MSLIDEIKIKSLSDAQEILKAAGSEDIFEKAHKDGDLHPNGKWVWVSSAAGGKGDWRTLNGRTHKKHQMSNAAGGGSSDGSSTGNGSKSSTTQPSSSSVKTTPSISPTFQKYFSISNSKFTDPKKMSVSKTPQGNWSLSYDGKRISTVAPLTDADKKKLESAGVMFDDTFKPKQKVNAKSETYSHKVNGVTITVSKNKDGSYTLEANGKKVKSDDPSFFKDKLTLRVKKALAKEVGIDASTTSKKTLSKKSVFNGNVVDAIKSSDLFGSHLRSNGKRSMGDIASINIGKPDTSNGKIPATVIYETMMGSYKSVFVTIDADGNVTKDNGWQSSQAFANLNDAKSYVEYGRRGKNTFNLKWEDEDDSTSSKTDDKEETGKDFNIVGASAQDIAENVAQVLGGKVTGSEKVKISGFSGSTIKAHKVTIGNESFFIHDGVFEKSYSKKGYARHKGFTVMKADGSSVMKYKLNSAGNRFTNAYSSNAGELGSWIKQRWGYGKKSSTKKTTATQTFEAQNAAAYDKGDGKVGNYPKPETRSLRASAILGMMHNNRHFGFKYGMDTNKIKEALEASGDKLVTVDMHNNAGTNEIYRIKFD